MKVYPDSMQEYHQRLEAAMIQEALRPPTIIVPSRINATLDAEQGRPVGQRNGKRPPPDERPRPPRVALPGPVSPGAPSLIMTNEISVQGPPFRHASTKQMSAHQRKTNRSKAGRIRIASSEPARRSNTYSEWAWLDRMRAGHIDGAVDGPVDNILARTEEKKAERRRARTPRAA
jgi:hypothetical protein